MTNPKQRGFLNPRLRDHLMQHGDAEIRYLQAIYDRIGCGSTEEQIQEAITQQDGYPLPAKYLNQLIMKHLRMIQQYHINRRK